MKSKTFAKLPGSDRPYNYESSQYIQEHMKNSNHDYLEEHKIATTEGHLDCAVRNFKCGLI